MPGVVKKHEHEWTPYLAGLTFVAAGVIFLWFLLKDWAKLVAR